MAGDLGRIKVTRLCGGGGCKMAGADSEAGAVETERRERARRPHCARRQRMRVRLGGARSRAPQGTSATLAGGGAS